MTLNNLKTSIISDLGANFNVSDTSLLDDILNEVVNNALIVSNRVYKDFESSLTLLASEIRRCTKTIYLQRGVEDAKSSTSKGMSFSYDDAMERLRNDIIKNGKRCLM